MTSLRKPRRKQNRSDSAGTGRGQTGGDDGDGTNDAPAPAQANVGVAMNTGTQAAKKQPTWLIWTLTHKADRYRCHWQTIADYSGALTTFRLPMISLKLRYYPSDVCGSWNWQSEYYGVGEC